MPLTIIRENLTELQCDALVKVASNSSLSGEKFKDLKVGEAKLFSAVDKAYSYSIYINVPCYKEENCTQLLGDCVVNALTIAKNKKLNSLVFPIISNAENCIPQDFVLSIVNEKVNNFLQDNNLNVYLTVTDKCQYSLNKELHGDLQNYIDKINVKNAVDVEFDNISSKSFVGSLEIGVKTRSSATSAKTAFPNTISVDLPTYNKSNSVAIPDFGSVHTIKEFMFKGFAESLFDLIDDKNIRDIDCYKRANVSRQTWHKITTDKSYKPTKNTIIAFAIALELDLDETQSLLATAGFILSKSSLFDVIIMFCIVKKIYDVFAIDSILYKYDQDTLFSKI